MTGSARGRVRRAGGCPTIRAWIVFAASVPIIRAIVSAPHDHFAAGPGHCVTGSDRRRVRSSDGRPRVVRAGTSENLWKRIGRVA